MPGIENNMGTVCCPTAVCGDVCGGTSCEDVDHENCCSGGIEESGIYCDDSGTAPCIIIIGKFLFRITWKEFRVEDKYGFGFYRAN